LQKPKSLLNAKDVSLNYNKTVQVLNYLGLRNNVSLRWIKAYIGFLYNGTVDRAAKNGTTSNRLGLTIPVAKRTF
jgi:hypothetical protein